VHTTIGGRRALGAWWVEKVTVTFGEPFDPLSLDGAAGPRERVVEVVHERVAELGARS
jgi:hypothetical protein